MKTIKTNLLTWSALCILAGLSISIISAAPPSGKGGGKGGGGGGNQNPPPLITTQTIAFGYWFGLGLVNPDGTETLLLENDSTLGTPQVSWSPDGMKLALLYDNGLYIFDIEDYNEASGNGDLYEPALLLSLEYSAAVIESVSWSPTPTADGQYKIAFSWSNPGQEQELSDIWVINEDGFELTQITDTPLESERHLDWSPDGSRLVIGSALYEVETDGSRSNIGTELSICIVESDGTDGVQLGASLSLLKALKDGSTDFRHFGTGVLKWSRSGEFIAIEGEGQDTSFNEAIYLVDADSNSPTFGQFEKLIEDNIGRQILPVWAPNDTGIMFRLTSEQPTGKGKKTEVIRELFFMDFSTGNYGQITDGIPLFNNIDWWRGN